MRWFPLALALSLALLAPSELTLRPALAQDARPLVVRPDPPASDDFETDQNADGVPDGWYNLRDAKLMPKGGKAGPHYLHFEASKPGRPARLSRAFGMDGSKYEAIIIGAWLRLDQIASGERQGDDPGLIIDFLGKDLRQTSRGSLGPWTMKSFEATTEWTWVSKRIPVPAETLDAIMSIGLLGATGVLDVDGLTFKLVPVGGEPTMNLAKNHDFELGDPDPFGWNLSNGARRVFPGFQSSSAVELPKAAARAMTGLALPVDEFPAVNLTVRARGQSLRGSGGASASVYFLDGMGRILPSNPNGILAFRWTGSFDWRLDRSSVNVPPGAERAVLQFEKLDSLGSLKIDDVTVMASEPAAGSWTPYHATEDTGGWRKVAPSTGIEPGSALDFSFLLDGPAGKHGGVTVKDGRFHFAKGDRARFLGVQVLAPSAFLAKPKADALADRLARSGVNLVRLGDLDTPLGPGLGMLDDTRDDTKAFDAEALGRLDHLIAALKQRGIYVALELQSARRFRSDDGVESPGSLPPGGGPAALFDKTMIELCSTTASELLARENSETSLRLRADPALAWVTLAGEVSLFNMIDNPSSLPSAYAKPYRDFASKSTIGVGRRFWESVEASHWKGLADRLRKEGLKAPVAGVSHWRREPEFVAAQASPGLDLIDDRIFYFPTDWVSPRFRSMLWSTSGGLLEEASRKRKPDRPYVVGQWCDQTQGTWSGPFEAAEMLLGAVTASAEDWDALVRRGYFLYPATWGLAAPGTAGGEDIFRVPEVVNASPQVFAMWPHAASIMLRGHHDLSRTGDAGASAKKAAASNFRGRRGTVTGWDPALGRLVVDTPFTQGIAGWPGGEAALFDHLRFDVENTYATVVASSVGAKPLAETKRLLVTAVARVTPTGFTWADEWRLETANPGVPPLLSEPVVARVTWTPGSGKISAYALDNDGNRLKPAKTVSAEGGATLILDGLGSALHYEMVAE